ncbi:MAG TPA: crosslink repair DNA glycosylase YcaQ family protein [Longimicrobiaceae bacterium]|nr:crosslink repair DNA glycosylase YcaQ family protein [Longimicrobiaceae bacterium]
MADLRLSVEGARALMLAAQGLDARPRRRATKADVLETIRRMGALQIDTIHVVARSPYLVLWSRLGDYPQRWLEELLAEGALFEYWAHEACFLPTESFPLFRHRMLNAEAMRWKYSAPLMAKRDEVERLLATIRERGPVRSADFERTDGRPGGWWEWKPEKRMLESLFTAGELMIARRERFQRVYDLRQRVLPGWDDARLPPKEETDRALVLQSVRALGVAKARWVADYFRMPKRGTPLVPERLAGEGALLRVEVEGWTEPGYVHPDHRETAERAAAGEIRPRLTTVLSPFDPLVWDRARARELFGFDYRLECYTPAPKRRFGYFVLPILRRGALVGRLDPKAHRREGVFEVRALHLEPGVRVTGGLVRDLARALRECAAWHGTPEVAVRTSDPPELARRLGEALAAA